jgi:hypothetical protein
LGVGKFLVTLGGIITLLGTYVFAIYGGAAVRGSGIGLILNIPDLFINAETHAPSILTPVALYYIYTIIFIIFLASGVLQILGRRSRLVSFIFSLFPLGVGLMFVFIAYTDVLGIRTQFFAIYFAGEALGNFYPFLIEMGYIDLGAYLLIAGGVLGVISVFSKRDEYY